MKLPFLITPEIDLTFFSEITPRFPNWERSFVSGKASTLFQVKHFIHSVRKTLVLSRVSFLPQAEGPPGNVHGGASAALIDEVMGISVWHQGEPSVTQKLELHYGKLLPLEHEAFVFTEIISSHAKTLEVHSNIYGSKFGSTEKEKTPYVSAQGVFYKLSSEQLANFKNKIGKN
jgi:acyl-coenzyme A thioesterase PaaI-like protein